VVKLADRAMGRGGRMSEAIAETGRGLTWIDIVEAEAFELAADFEAS